MCIRDRIGNGGNKAEQQMKLPNEDDHDERGDNLSLIHI